ncbi:thioredoxin family protein [Ectobacillus sp. JY-23]|uniref:thioredoxin family protein n=1 Tax=Ectobacillus sp. JY-23 TaxID=2933872 RepID=UPI001FF2BAD3|nr:thioredoxin family protein [Ectobacillus sp. JY-23]UOY90999.1 thioredoxin family protein [Ectobacillus sp. JY-23]
MIEWTEQEAMKRANEPSKTVLYAHTPLCGTCQLAKKMLTVVEAALPSLEIGMVDLNYAPVLARTYEIESVPCLLVLHEGKVYKQIYAFRSVDYLYHELK